jgi:hypothetical protein
VAVLEECRGGRRISTVVDQAHPSIVQRRGKEWVKIIRYLAGRRHRLAPEAFVAYGAIVDGTLGFCVQSVEVCVTLGRG